MSEWTRAIRDPSSRYEVELESGSTVVKVKSLALNPAYPNYFVNTKVSVCDINMCAAASTGRRTDTETDTDPW